MDKASVSRSFWRYKKQCFLRIIMGVDSPDKLHDDDVLPLAAVTLSKAKEIVLVDGESGESYLFNGE